MKVKHVLLLNIITLFIGTTLYGQLNLDVEGYGTISERLGIGTSFPDELLEVQGSGMTTRIGVTTTTSDNASFRARTPNSDFGWYADGNENAFKLYDFNALGDRMTINADGNVGIGTTSPSNKLVILDNRDDNFLYTVIRNTGDGGAGLWLFNDDNSQGSSKIIMKNAENTTAQYWGIGNDRTDGNKFKIAPSSTIEGQSQFVIDRNGSVGIGTTSPGSTLHVEGQGLFDGSSLGLVVTSDNHDQSNLSRALRASIAFDDNAANKRAIDVSVSGQGVLHYGLYSNIQSGTAYGVWTRAAGSSTSYGVYGSTLGNGTVYGVYGFNSVHTIGTAYAGYFNGDLAYTGTITDVSDRKFKENIEPIENALRVCLKIKLYYFI